MRILILGDSNTYGFDAKSRKRFEKRYPNLLKQESEDEIIEEGLNGRTIAREDPFDPDRNLLKNGTMLIKSHLPLDWIFLNLGTNDTKQVFHSNAHTLERGMQAFLDVLTNPNLYRSYPHQSIPKILIIHPTRMHPNFIHKEEIKIQFGQEAFDLLENDDLFKSSAQMYGAYYLDPHVRADPFDSIHLNEQGHEQIAKSIKEKLKEII